MRAGPHARTCASPVCGWPQVGGRIECCQKSARREAIAAESGMRPLSRVGIGCPFPLVLAYLFRACSAGRIGLDALFSFYIQWFWIFPGIVYIGACDYCNIKVFLIDRYIRVFTFHQEGIFVHRLNCELVKKDKIHTSFRKSIKLIIVRIYVDVKF